jgi:hypothetical protein
MSFVISRDNGAGNPPSFLGREDWGTLDQSRKFPSEASAQMFIDNADGLAGCIVMPFDETLMSVTNEKPVEVLSGMEPDTDHQP